ncbi:nudix (nucleoside diphosphate linked moiety X)-type motif 8 [Mortierella sp. AD011]|nr:nudix (nucleoside diphosphate linked moiety X)-type motif 8 [Mortierella sp. AD010]KAF9403370.1 nudix (nucleoside diphosphate linked moiety X)-type motif 8 [Mortierella sp. AD011]
MSGLLMPSVCRCPQRSMLSQLVTAPSTIAFRTGTRVIVTSSKPQSTLASQHETFISQPFLLNADTSDRLETKVFAPLYQTQDFQYLPYNVPPVPKPYPQQSSSPVYPSHQQRLKRHTSLKNASYASRTIPPMMSSVPQAPIQFDREFLDMVKSRLEEEKHQIGYQFDRDQDKPFREAAVLMPLCIVKGVPSVLFTVRSSKLRSHSGECSFPGGKRDPSDQSCLAAALREVEEEISIPSNDVEVLGEYTPIPNKDGTMCVYPYIGFIRKPIDDVSEIRYNPDEVSKVFSVPIEDLLNPEKRKHLARFRDSKYVYPVCHVEEEGCTIWGLTAFIMDGALRRIMKQGPVGAMICPEGADIRNYRPTP